MLDLKSGVLVKDLRNCSMNSYFVGNGKEKNLRCLDGMPCIDDNHVMNECDFL